MSAALGRQVSFSLVLSQTPLATYHDSARNEEQLLARIVADMIRRIASILLAVTFATIGCDSSASKRSTPKTISPTASQPATLVSSAPSRPTHQDGLPATNQTATLTSDEAIRRFRARASAEELRQFERNIIEKDEASKTRAQELVLFKLAEDELFELGITQVDQAGRLEWGVAWSDDSPEVAKAIREALIPTQIFVGCSCSSGSCGWYVPREQFFCVRKALLASKAIISMQSGKMTNLRIKITEPTLKLP